MMILNKWSLAVHGGAKEKEAGEEEANRRGSLAALAAGRAILEEGGPALDAVQAAVRVLEDDPTFNAGYGSALNEAGEVEMCSALMNGRDLSVGAVAVIKGVRNPVDVARRVMERSDAILIAGPGARQFAEKQGLALCDPRELIVEKQKQALSEHDTVGAVAMDCDGNFAAATSTGGLPGAPVGRMADSTLPGCGYYAQNGVGAIALSGKGEAIARLSISAKVMADLASTDPAVALERHLSQLTHLGGDGGGIAIGPDGRIGWWHNSPMFAVAAASQDEPEGRAWLGKEEA